MGKNLAAIVGAVAFVVAVAAQAQAADPGLKCSVTKLKAAAKKVSRKMSCHAKAKAKNVAVDAACLAKAEAAYASAFAKAGSCPGDAASVESLVDDCVSDFLTADPNNDKCGASSAKALGKGAYGEIGCEEKALIKGSDASACRAGVATKTGVSLGKAGSCTTGAQTAITACVDSVTAALPPTTTTSTTSTTLPPACCSAGRITMVGSSGATQKVGGFSPYPVPSGMTLVLDYGSPDAGCKHDVTIAPGGFTMPTVCIAGVQFAASVEAIGCESGTGAGAGALWDGNAQLFGGVPMTNISKVADSSDGTCDPGGTCMNTDQNFLGDIDATPGVGGAADKLGTLVDIPVHVRIWQDAAGCPGDGIYNSGDGDAIITEFDTIVSPTTGQATGSFADENADGCSLPGGSSGFGGPLAGCAAGASGPCGSTGVPADGPCCVVGDALTTVQAGVWFSNSFPMYDLGYYNTIPMSVTSCDAFQSNSCTVTTDACNF